MISNTSNSSSIDTPNSCDKEKKEHFIRLGHTRYKNVTTKALLLKDTVTESPPKMKSITRFREEFTKKVGTLLKGGGNM